MPTTTYTYSIRFGTTTTEKQFSSPQSYASLANNMEIKARLGYSDRVRAVVDGVEQDENAQATEATTICFETACQRKA